MDKYVAWKCRFLWQIKKVVKDIMEI